MEQLTLDTPHLRFLRTVREYELKLALAHFPLAHQDSENPTVLEIGAGTGQQAKLLSELGYGVTAIDLPSSHYRNDRVFEITEYDGYNIPLPDRSIDVVFSSNVLEHVLEIDSFLDEQQRVMKDDGVTIHVLPSTSCRVWAIPAHYAWLARRILTLVTAKQRRIASISSNTDRPSKHRSARDWLITLVPMPHGERGNTLSEAYYFSRYWWRQKFLQHGFTIVRIEGNGLFYTMANAFADSLNFKVRSGIARFLGSACHVYVLTRDQTKIVPTQPKSTRVE